MGKLEIENITKRYQDDNTVVSKVNIQIDENELATIVGPSGCGKTTTLRMVAGFIVPNEGRIAIDGKDVVNTKTGLFLQPEKREIGMVFQTYAVWPHMNVFNNISYPLKIRKMDKKVIKNKMDKVLNIVGLDKFVHRFPHELSGGQQQRVALARALVMEPKLLLLDEPLSNLDAALRAQMRSEIKDIQRRMRVTIINVTHDRIEAMSMSDKVIVMDKGHLIQMGSPEELYEKPINTFVAKFIGSSNILPCEWVRDASNKEMVISLFGEEIKVHKKNNTEEKKGYLAVLPQKIEFNNESSLRGRIDRKLYLGHSIEYYISVGKDLIRVLSDVKNNFSIDEIVGFKINSAVWLKD